jgi:hypothetical protein
LHGLDQLRILHDPKQLENLYLRGDSEWRFWRDCNLKDAENLGPFVHHCLLEKVNERAKGIEYVVDNAANNIAG